MDNTKVLCYSPESDISPICQNLEEVLSICRIAACKVYFCCCCFPLEVKKSWVASGSSHMLRRVLFTWLPVLFVGWMDSRRNSGMVICVVCW